MDEGWLAGRVQLAGRVALSNTALASNALVREKTKTKIIVQLVMSRLCECGSSRTTGWSSFRSKDAVVITVPADSILREMDMIYCEKHYEKRDNHLKHDEKRDTF
jgi:hypothetical protein